MDQEFDFDLQGFAKTASDVQRGMTTAKRRLPALVEGMKACRRKVVALQASNAALQRENEQLSRRIAVLEGRLNQRSHVLGLAEARAEQQWLTREWAREKRKRKETDRQLQNMFVANDVLMQDKRDLEARLNGLGNHD